MGNQKNQKRPRKKQLKGIVKKQKLAKKESRPNICSKPAEVDKPSTSSSETKLHVKDPLFNVETGHQNLSLSASEKKIKKNVYPCYQENAEDDHSFIVLDSKLLCDFLDSIVKCRICYNFLQTKICFENGRGFCFDVMGHCQTCKTDNFLFATSTTCKKEGVFQSNQKKTPYAINLRMVTFTKELGLGLAALQTVSKCLNSLPPISQSSYDTLFGKYSEATKAVAEESMKQAADEVIEEQDGNHDTMVSVDGTWQRRGHSSHNGIVSAVSVVTGKVLDIAVLSNYCKGCAQWTQQQQHTPEYLSWKASHVCSLNHDGSAGSMEPKGAIQIFHRSQAERNLRYTEFLGDGDSASFLQVKASKPYGEELIVKNDCVGHVQKRVGSRLRKLCKLYQGKKLIDGKPLTGKNRLTSTAIDTLQNYYGMAIRENTHSLTDMVNSVLAVLYHVASTDDKPNHSLCPVGENSWCGWQRDSTTYKHRHGLPEAVVELLEPIFDDLSNPELLKKCLHGKTQNANECLNKEIWSRCPKEMWFSYKTVQQSAYAAVAKFNDGNISYAKTMMQLGINPGHFSLSICKKLDSNRITKSKRRSSVQYKQRRKTLRAIKKGFHDKKQTEEGTTYAKGDF